LNTQPVDLKTNALSNILSL